MTDQSSTEAATAASNGVEVESEDTGPVVRDRRKLDPETGQVRPQTSDTGSGLDATFSGQVGADTAETLSDDAATLSTVQQQSAEHLADLQRLQAEYANYRKRVERDQNLARDFGVNSVLESLLPVLDDLSLAQEHGDLAGGPFASIAEKLNTALTRFGLEQYGAPGEAFDPQIHEALVHSSDAELPPEATTTTVVTVMQPGYRVGERVLRPARVAVADPV